MKMKKTFKFLTLTVLLSMAGVLSAFAAVVTDLTYPRSGLTYKVIEIDWKANNSGKSKGTLSVMGNPADQSNPNISIEPGFTVRVTGTYDGVERDDNVTFTVVEILPNAFRGMNQVTHLTIPGTVKTIGEGALANMTGLTYMKIGSVTDPSNLTTIGNFVFGNDPIETLDLIGCPDLDLSGSTPLLNAFGRENHTLKTVILPKQIENIGTALAGLSALENLNLDQTNVSNLEAGALRGTNIKEIVLPRPTEVTNKTTKIGENALPETLVTLKVRGDIVEDGIKPQAGLKDLKNVWLQGALLGKNAIAPNVFPNSKIEKLGIGGTESAANNNAQGIGVLAEGAIANDAFKGQNKLNYISFNGPVNAKGIGQNAFEGAGECAEVIFRGALGVNAIGIAAFKDASISKLTFKKDLANNAICLNGFYGLKCNADVTFNGNLGAGAIGQSAFETAHLNNVTFDKDIKYLYAIKKYAFKQAQLLGNLTFSGKLVHKQSIETLAFEEADIQGSIFFNGDITGELAIDTKAFYNFKNTTGTTPITFKNISGKNAIGVSAFENGAVASVTIDGSVSGEGAIGGNAFRNTPMTELTIIKTGVGTGEVSNNSAISAGAFADNKKLATINFGGNLYSPVQSTYAIAPGAFENVGKEVTNGATLNVNGAIKTPAAIAAGAFAGALLNVVNFNELVAEKAIADNQFGELSGNPAKITTVNFNAEFKAYTDGGQKNFIGENAFTGTGLKLATFKKVSVADAICASAEDKSPFAAKSDEYDENEFLTLKFDGDVCTSGFGKYAFSNSNTRMIELNNANEFAKLAFSSESFLNIALNGREPGNTKIVTIKYDNPSSSVDINRSFDVTDFYATETNVDIKFVTTDEVKQMYSTDVNAKDLTPYRLKFFVSKHIKMNRISDDFYYGFFEPEDEQYIIEKYQKNGYNEETWGGTEKDSNGNPIYGPKSHKDAIVGVYSAYSDDQTLTTVDGYSFTQFGGKPFYYADLYLNPLRVQEKGKYVLNQGHTFIVTSNKKDDVIATQDDNNMRDGGVQTFAGLTPWACNDLRWNPGRISARYDASGNKINGMFTLVNDGETGCFTKDATGKFKWAGLNAGEYAVKPGHEWDGEVSWVAIQNNDPDYYGNVLRNYQIFVSNPGSYGFEFANAPLIPEKAAYVLVGAYGDTDENKYSVQKQNRKNYSENNIYPVDGLDNGVEDLIEKLESLLKVDNNNLTSDDAALKDWLNKTLKAAEKAGYDFRVSGDGEDGDPHVSDDAHKEAIVKAFKKIFGEPKQRQKLDDAGQPVVENGVPVMEDYYDLENLANGTTIKDLMTQFNKLCTAKQKVAAAEQKVADLDKICKDENAPFAIRELLKGYEKYSKLLEVIEKKKDLAELSKIAITWQDDLYQQYLSFKDNSDNVPAETKEKYQELYKDFSTLAEAIAKYAEAKAWVENDAHALAYYNKVTFQPIEHTFAPVYGAPDDIQYGNIEFKYTGETMIVGTNNYKEIEVFANNVTLVGAKSPIQVGEKYWVNAAGQNPYVNTFDGTNMVRLTNEEAAPKDFDLYIMLVQKYEQSSTNDFEAVRPADGSVEPLYSAGENNTDIDERKNVKDLVDAEIVIRNLIGKLKLDVQNYSISMGESSLNVPSEVAEGLAAKVSEQANNYKDIAWLWYSDQVNESGRYAPGSKEVYTWTIANVNRQAEKELANIASVEEYLATDACYKSYIAAVNALGKDAKDAVAGTPNTYYTQTVDGIQRIVFEDGAPKIKKAGKVAKAAVNASVLKKGVVTAETALNNFIAGEYNNDVAALAAAINLIDQELTNAYNAGARLNIIWNDRPEEVVGIMEAVVNKKAAAAVKGNAIYNLNGMRVNKAQKGIYIQNGQKVVVK